MGFYSKQKKQRTYLIWGMKSFSLFLEFLYVLCAFWGESFSTALKRETTLNCIWRKKMKKILPVLPLFLGILACGIQSPPTQDVDIIVNATLTAIAQNDSQGSAPQSTLTPVSIHELPTTILTAPSGLHYYWPTTLPEGFVLNTSNSDASDNGFTLEFIDPSMGTINISGGNYVELVHCAATDAIPQIVRGFDGCFPQTTGGGFSIQWVEGGVSYSVGGLGLSRDLAHQIAEQLESLDITTWKERLMQ